MRKIFIVLAFIFTLNAFEIDKELSDVTNFNSNGLIMGLSGGVQYSRSEKGSKSELYPNFKFDSDGFMADFLSVHLSADYARMEENLLGGNTNKFNSFIPSVVSKDFLNDRKITEFTNAEIMIGPGFNFTQGRISLLGGISYARMKMVYKIKVPNMDNSELDSLNSQLKEYTGADLTNILKENKGKDEFITVGNNDISAFGAAVGGNVYFTPTFLPIIAKAQYIMRKLIIDENDSNFLMEKDMIEKAKKNKHDLDFMVAFSPNSRRGDYRWFVGVGYRIFDDLNDRRQQVFNVRFGFGLY